MKRVTNGFDQLSIAEFSQRLRTIVSSLTGNAYFTTIDAAIQDLNTGATAYYPMVIAAEGGDRGKIADRNAARQELTDKLHSIGYSVSGIAKGNEAILISSGFRFTQAKKPTPPLQRPAMPGVSAGVNPGELLCITTAQYGMKSVNYYITSDVEALKATDGSGWDIISYNRVKYTFDNLVSGQRYYIKVGLVGVRGQEVISDAVSYIPQ